MTLFCIDSFFQSAPLINRGQFSIQWEESPTFIYSLIHRGCELSVVQQIMVLGFIFNQGQCVVFHFTTPRRCFSCVSVWLTRSSFMLFSVWRYGEDSKGKKERHKSDSATLQIDPGMRAERGNVDGAVTGESGWPSNPSTHAAVCNSSWWKQRKTPIYPLLDMS